MGFEILQWYIIVSSPRHSRSSEGVEAIIRGVKANGREDPGKSGRDHGCRNWKGGGRGEGIGEQRRSPNCMTQ